MGNALHLGWPNRVTIARILLIGPFVVCLLDLNDPGRGYLRYVAIGLFALMAASDWLDGFLARRLHDQSALGRFLDPLADKLLVTFAVIILCVEGIHVSDGKGGEQFLRVPNWVVVAAVGKDLLVSLGFAIVYLITGRVLLEPRRLGKLCTCAGLAMVLAMLLWIDLPGWLYNLPVWLWYLTAVLAIVSAIDYIRVGGRFVAASPKPGGPSQET